MMACWQRLGLAPTNDERAIKRAYAKILKTIDQDAEPEQFIVLREAMQQALDQARYADWDEAEDAAAEDLAAENLTVIEPISDPVAIIFDDIASPTTDTDSPDPITSPLSMSSTWMAAEPIDQQNDQRDSVFNQHPIWQEWQPNQQQVETFKRDVDQLCQWFWADQYDDTSYRAFIDVLRRLPEQPLALQMQVQEQLSGLLAQAPEQPDTERFIQTCIEQLDWQDDVVGRDTVSSRLQQRFAVLNAKKQFWQMVPTAYFQDLQVLADGSRLAWRSMWHLSGSKDPKILALKQAYWQTIPYRDPDLQRNLALQLLLRIRLLYPANLIVVFMVVWLFSIELSTKYLYIAIIPAVCFSVHWQWMVVAPFSAWMTTKPNIERYRACLLVGWITLALLNGMLLVVLPPFATVVLVGCWGLLSTLWMGTAFEQASSWLPKEILSTIRNKIDAYLVFFTVFSLMIVASQLFREVLFNKLPSELSEPLWFLSIFLLLPLIGLLLRDEMIREFKQLFLIMKSWTSRTKKRVALILGGAVFVERFLSNRLDFQIDVLLIVGGAFLSSLLFSSRWVSLILKHGIYLFLAFFIFHFLSDDGAILFLAVLAAIPLCFWFLTLWQDYKAYQASRVH